MTGGPLSTHDIRRLLGKPVQDRHDDLPSTTVVVDGQPVRAWGDVPDEDTVRRGRETIDLRNPPLRGMPSLAERAKRTERNLQRLRGWQDLC